LISRELLAKANPKKRRLRSFLLGSFKKFISEEQQHAQRKKRGGGEAPLPLHMIGAEVRYQRAPADNPNPEVLFERNWANVILQGALDRVRAEERGQGKVFARLQEFLAWNSADTSVESAAQELSMSTGAIRVAIHRLRLRFRHRLEEDIAQTVSSPDELQAEVRHLIRAVSGASNA